MGTRDEGEAVVVVERFRDVLAEGVAGPSRRDAPAAPIVRVGPEQVAHGPLVRHLLHAVEGADVVERVDAGRQAAVEAEDLVVDEGRQGEKVEEVGEAFPDAGVAVLPEALVVEAVHLRDLTRLVVAPEDRDALREPDLERHQQRHRLDRVVATIDVVACTDARSRERRPSEIRHAPAISPRRS